MPPTAAMTKPAMARYSVSPRLIHKIAADGVGVDALDDGGERRQHERRHPAAAGEQLPGDQHHQNGKNAGAAAEHDVETPRCIVR